MKASKQRCLIVLTLTVLVTGFVFWCLIEDRSLVSDGPSWQISDVLMSKVTNDENIKSMIGLLQNKLSELQRLAMIKYTDVKMACKSTDNDASLCIDSNCPDTLVPQMSPQNILSILKPVVRVGKDKLRKAMDAFEVKPQGIKYTFVTGASHNHFHESRVAMETLRKNVLPYISNYSLIFYDLGLCDAERDIVSNTFGFEVRSYPFKRLPKRTHYLYCYTWKTLIVLAHLPHTEVLVWMDSSIQTKQEMVPALINVTKTGILIGTDRLQFPQHVMLKMFSYFGDRPCHFSKYEELEANFFILHNEPFVRQLIIEPWAACALDPTCMCPHESRSLLMCPSVHKYGKCHRYDQATLGYIVHKLFREAEASVILQPKEVHEVIRTGYPLSSLDIFCLGRKGMAWLVGWLI